MCAVSAEDFRRLLAKEHLNNLLKTEDETLLTSTAAHAELPLGRNTKERYSRIDSSVIKVQHEVSPVSAV